MTRIPRPDRLSHPAGQVDGGLGDGGGRREIAHEQRPVIGLDPDAGDLCIGIGRIDQPAVEEVRLQSGHGRGRRFDADRRQAGVRVPTDRGPTNEWADSDDRGSRAPHGVPDSGNAQDDADGHNRVARRQDDRVGVADRLEHAWRRTGSRQRAASRAVTSESVAPWPNQRERAT